MSSPIALVASGLGSYHAAVALAETLQRREEAVDLITDLDQDKIGPYASLFGSVRNLFVATQPDANSSYTRPSIMVGLGGNSATAQAFSIAASLNIPTVYLETNIAVNPSNAELARSASAVATSFRTLLMPDGALPLKTVFTGHPVRDAFRQILHSHVGCEYVVGLKNDDFRLVVLSADIGDALTAALPAAVALFDERDWKKLSINHQCQLQDCDALRAAYKKVGVRAVVLPFFENLPQLIAEFDSDCRPTWRRYACRIVRHGQTGSFGS